MTLTTYADLDQGTDEWDAARRGILTASVLGRLIAPKTIKPASNVESRAITLQLIAERITGYTEPTFVSFDMEMGHVNEPIARDVYSEHFAPVAECGFMRRDEAGWRLGYSPDGLVGDDGLIEVKSRDQKTQLATVLNDKVPDSNMAQLQAGLLVSGRAWIDYVSICPGMPLYRKRVEPDKRWRDAIITVATAFETSAAETIDRYHRAIANMPSTERDILTTELRF